MGERIMNTAFGIRHRSAKQHNGLRLVVSVVAIVAVFILGGSAASAQTWEELNESRNWDEARFLDPTGFYCGGKPVTLRVAADSTNNVLVIGTPGDDVIMGTSGSDDILAGEGNDTICGMGGSDLLAGEGGDDHIWGGSNTVNVNTELFTVQPERTETPKGVTRIFGGAGNDVLNGSGQVDNIFGGPGDDYLNGGGRGDNLDGGSGSDTFTGGSPYKDEDLCYNFGPDDRNFGGACDRTVAHALPVLPDEDNCWIRMR